DTPTCDPTQGSGRKADIWPNWLCGKHGLCKHATRAIRENVRRGRVLMKRVLTGVALGTLAVAVWGVMIMRNESAAQVRIFDITWIDTEGGAATLMVTPGGDSFLIDTGYPDADRDAKRIFAAAQKAGLSKIDHVLISHFHGDHVGGLRALSKMIPI